MAMADEMLTGDQEQTAQGETQRVSASIVQGGGATPAVQGGGAGPVSAQSPARDGDVLPPNGGRKRQILLAFLLAGLIGGGYWGYGWYTEGRFLVSTDDAYVKADLSTIAAKVPGYVTTVAVTDNQHVNTGDVLVKIDDGDYVLAVRNAQDKLATQDAVIARIEKQGEAQQSAIAQARAQLTAAQADQTRAAADLERAETLARSDFGTRARLDQARADYDRAAATVQGAQSGIDAAQAQLGVLQAQTEEARRTRAELVTALDKAERDLSFTQIRAPFGGVVGNRAAQPGQYVQAGTRLLALVPLDSAYVEANFKETQLARLKPGQPVDVAVDALGGKMVTGTVASLAPASGSQYSLLPPDNATGNFTKIVQRVPVRIVVPKEIAEQGLLRPGLSVVVSVNTREMPAPQSGAALAQDR